MSFRSNDIDYMPKELNTPRKQKKSLVNLIVNMFVACQIGKFVPKKHLSGCFGKTSLLTSPKSGSGISPDVNGSVTIEAAVILPLLLLTVFTVLGFFPLMEIQAVMQGELYSLGKELAKTAYGYELVQENKEVAPYLDIAETLYTQGYVRTKLGKSLDGTMADSMLVGGVNGLSLRETSILKQNDMIDLVISYDVELPVQVVPLPTIHIVQRCRMHGWVGAMESKEEKSEAKREQQVYITPTGEVYHTHPACTHLKLSVRAVSGQNIEDKCNSNGESYSACELCVESISLQVVYVTEYGNRFHQSSKCSGLKRGIQQIGIKNSIFQKPLIYQGFSPVQCSFFM